MAILETTYNENVNPMDFAYLRSSIIAPFLSESALDSGQQEGDEDDEVCNCCDFDKNYIMPMMASTADSDSFKNDYYGFYYQAGALGVTQTFILQSHVGGSWIDVVTLDSSYGTQYTVGMFTDYPLIIGYKINWRPVIIDFGEGLYRVKTATLIPILSGITINRYSTIFCLKEYSIHSSDRTVRFEWNNNGYISQSDDNFNIINWGNTNLQNMIRITGNFRYDKDEQEVVDISFFSGQALEVERIRDKTNYKYKFNSGYVPDWVHAILKNVAFKSNSLIVTNYNKLSKHQYTRKAILKEPNGYSPKMDNTYKKWYNVEVDFRDKYDDLGFRKNCQPSGINCADVTIKDQDGNIITTVPSGSTYIDNQAGGGTVTIENSNATYTDTVTCGTTDILPDTTVNVYLDGVLVGTDTVVTLDPAAELNITW